MLEKDIEALSALFGGRIQKVDLIGRSELVLHLRYPGRTILLLVASDRAGVVAERPERAIDGGDLQRALRKRLEGRPLVALELDKHQLLVVDAKDTRFVMKKNAIEWLPPSGVEPPPLPTTLPEHFPIAKSKATDDLARRIAAKKKKLARLVQNLTRDRDRLTAMLAMKKLGELMKPMLGTIARGATEAMLTDWETGQEIRVELDPASTAKQNMERFFSKAKKAERGLPQVAKRLALVEKQLAELEQGVLPEEPVLSARDPEQRAPEKKKPIDKVARRFVALDGTEIRVGKGASENDRLTLSFAKGDDIWLHASGTQGAHVLLKAQKGKPPSAEALLDAAMLAAHYSGGKNDSKVEVVWTEARYVKKTKGDPPGRVSVAKGRTLLVAMEKARIDRLFGR